jgi:hypothetical protein
VEGSGWFEIGLGRQLSDYEGMLEKSSNDKIQMSNEIQNPNVKRFSKESAIYILLPFSQPIRIAQI